jgi:microcystin-dependent protein
VDRRTVIVRLGAGVVALPALKILWSCGGDGGGADAGTGTGTDAGADAGKTDHTFTSSEVSGHTHQLTITEAQFANPPAAGLKPTSSTDAGHSHLVEITQAQLNDIQGGQSVTVTSAISGGHTHSFTLTKA